MIERLRNETRDLFELVLIPGLAMVLPWWLCFRLFKLLASFSFLYRQQTYSALRQARQRGWVKEEKSWLLMRRLVTLVDHADYYLVLTRSDAWLRRHFEVQGHWPSPGKAAILSSFHWGAGMWTLRHAVATGLTIHALAAPIQGKHFKGRRVMHWYAKARTAMVSKTLGCATLDVSASLRPVLQAVRDQEQVLAVVDVPADQVSASQTLSILGQTARVPRGVFRLAVEHQLPITLFLAGFRIEDGRRFLRLQQFNDYDKVTELMVDVFAVLEQAITENPAAWHFWSEAERFFISNDIQEESNT